MIRIPTTQTFTMASLLRQKNTGCHRFSTAFLQQMMGRSSTEDRVQAPSSCLFAEVGKTYHHLNARFQALITTPNKQESHHNTPI